MNFIVVVDQNYGIGYRDQLLAHIPEDLKYFKKMTLGNVIIMGRKTLEGLPGGKPLTNRTTIVLTNNTEYINEEVIVVHNLTELFECLKEYDDDSIFVAGGEAIYQQLIPYCYYGYITYIEETFNADKYLMPIHDMAQWKLIWVSEEKSYNNLNYKFTKYLNQKVIKRP